MKTGIELIAEERDRQLNEENYTPDHDDEHVEGELSIAAANYAMAHIARRDGWKNDRILYWPFEKESWKPSGNDRVRELVKAGALLAAEIDRLKRKEEHEHL
jgi:hypothetical protein